MDRELKRLWTGALRELREGDRDSASGFDRRYETLGRILEHAPPLYLAGGYATARAFLEAEVPGESERSVMRWVRVARFASPADEVRCQPRKYREQARRGDRLPREAGR